MSKQDLKQAIQYKAPRWWVYQKRPVTCMVPCTPSKFNEGQSIAWFTSEDIDKYVACPDIGFAKYKAKYSSNHRGYMISDICEYCNRNMNFMAPSKWKYLICNQDKTSYIKRVIPI